MLKRTISFSVALVLCAGLYAQDNPNIVGVLYYKPKDGQREQFLMVLRSILKNIIVKAYQELEPIK